MRTVNDLVRVRYTGRNDGRPNGTYPTPRSIYCQERNRRIRVPTNRINGHQATVRKSFEYGDADLRTTHTITS